jgi:hypothetical protein
VAQQVDASVLRDVVCEVRDGVESGNKNGEDGIRKWGRRGYRMWIEEIE